MLTVIHNSVDISREQGRFEFLSSEVDFDGKYLYVGYKKPIPHVYLNLNHPHGHGNANHTLTLSYWDGATWQSVKGLMDLTFGLTRSGSVKWNLNQPNEAKTTVEGVDLYWYRLSLAPGEEIEFKGIGPLFSDDYDLVQVIPDIMDKLPTGQTSFVRFHDEALKDIVKDLRKAGLVIDNTRLDPSQRKQIDAYDLLDKEEIREAAKYFALSKIFAWLSDQPEDKWDQLSAKYQSEAAGSITPLITVDIDNNGLLDDSERAEPQPIIIGRL
jgi:hypothetical protein